MAEREAMVEFEDEVDSVPVALPPYNLDRVVYRNS
jgi:hypothetical protein